jgi:hypothetical protein
MIVSTLIAGLAGARLTRAWSYETIGEAVNAPIVEWAENFSTDDDGVITSSNAELTVKSWVADLVDCPYCIGFWLTLGCVVGLRFRLTRPIVIALAAAAIQSALVDHYPGFDHGESEQG